MVIVTGLGRCGTSFLMHVLQESGVALGHQVHWYEEIDAGLELAPAYRTTVDMYVSFCDRGKQIELDKPAADGFWAGKTFREAINAIGTDERVGAVAVIKDPRMSWHPALLQAWCEGRSDEVGVLLCHRAVGAIVASRELFGISDPKRSRDCKPEAYDEDFAKLLQMLVNNKIKFELAVFPEFLQTPALMSEKLNALGLSFDKSVFVSNWNKLVDHSKVHF